MARIHRRTISKSLNDPDDYNGVPHLESDILKYEVKWALRSVTMSKASGSDRISAELFKILEYNSVKMLHSIY